MTEPTRREQNRKRFGSKPGRVVLTLLKPYQQTPRDGSAILYNAGESASFLEEEADDLIAQDFAIEYGAPEPPPRDESMVLVYALCELPSSVTGTCTINPDESCRLPKYLADALEKQGAISFKRPPPKISAAEARAEKIARISIKHAIDSAQKILKELS